MKLKELLSIVSPYELIEVIGDNDYEEIEAQPLGKVRFAEIADIIDNKIVHVISNFNREKTYSKIIITISYEKE